MGEDSKFNNTILTNIGHQMLTSTASGNRKITYTKAEAYTQDVSSIANETLQALTSLQGKELSTNLLVSNDNGNVVTITANFENKGLTNDVVFNSIGWFAKLDTDDAERGITANQEYLIGITPANGAQTLVAPPADQSASQAISLNLNMTLSDAANVNMTVSDAGAVHFNQLYDQLAEYTTTSDLTKLLAGKADLGLSYTKAELDAKLLDLTTDTNGKVSADQVKALISDKANISDVYTKSQIDSDLSTRDAQINAKANASDVYTKSQIDSDLSARDTQIANATSLANQAQATANTKANASDVTEISGRLGKLEGIQTVDSPDFNGITASGVYYITNNNGANLKNNPVAQWGVLIVSNGDGHRVSQVYYPDDGNPPWCRSLNESDWLPWYQLSTKKDVSNAVSLANKAQDTANQANTRLPLTGGAMNSNAEISFNNDTFGKQGGLTWNGSTDWAKIYGDVTAQDNLDLAFDLGDDGSNHFSFRRNGSETSAITSDGHYTGTVDWSRVNGRPEVTPVINGSAGDDLFAYKTNQIRLYNGNGSTCKNLPPASNTQWFTVQYVIEGPNNNGIAIYRTPFNEIWTVGFDAGSYTLDLGKGWLRVANSNDISNLQSTINQQNQTIQSLITRLNNAENEIKYIKDNYIEGKRFPASQEAQAEAWENEKPTRLAMIEK